MGQRKNGTSFVLLSLALVLPALVSTKFVNDDYERFRRSPSTSSDASLDPPDKFNVTPEDYDKIKNLFAKHRIADNEADFQKHVKCMDRLNEIAREIKGIDCNAKGQKCGQKFLEYVVNELKSNPDSTAYLYQGDITLNPQQVDMKCAEGEKRLAEFRAKKSGKSAASSTGVRRRRHVLADPSFAPRWNINPIPYKMTGNVVQSDITGAISLLQNNTCLRFVYTPSLASGQYGINFNEWSTVGVCNSPVGMQPSSYQPQTINLPSVANGGCGIPATVHEMCHSLGSNHEQIRTDRDNYVYVDDSNIQSAKLHNFEPADSTDVTYGTPYDYLSDMHYGANFFAIDNTQPNIYTNDPDFQESIGQEIMPGMTFYDYYVLNQAYCQTNCQGVTGPQCKNSGYQDPNNCSKCKCPSMFTGTDCSTPKQSNSACGQTSLIAQPGVQQTITLSGNAQCFICIKAADGVSNVNLYVNTLDYGYGSPQTGTQVRGCPVYSNTQNSYVEILAGPDFGLNGARCCYIDDVANNPIVSVGPQLCIFYNSGDSSFPGNFQATYST